MIVHCEAVPGGDGAEPVVHLVACEFCGAPAAAAHDVVVMVWLAGAVDVLVAHSQNVHVAGFGELLEISVHGGKPNALALRGEQLVNLLRRVEALDLVQDRPYRRLLPSHALHSLTPSRFCHSVALSVR